jgi:hypothetical protein
MRCDLDWRQEPIALADDSLHKSRRVGIVIERPPDLADDGVDRCVLVDEHVAGPELGAQILARDQCAASLDELDERIHRQPLELHEPGAGAQFVRCDIELEPAEAIYRIRANDLEYGRIGGGCRLSDNLQMRSMGSAAPGRQDALRRFAMSRAQGLGLMGIAAVAFLAMSCSEGPGGTTSPAGPSPVGGSAASGQLASQSSAHTRTHAMKIAAVTGSGSGIVNVTPTAGADGFSARSP